MPRRAAAGQVQRVPHVLLTGKPEPVDAGGAAAPGHPFQQNHVGPASAQLRRHHVHIDAHTVPDPPAQHRAEHRLILRQHR